MSAPREPSDQVLVAQARTGSEDAFEQLVERHHGPAMRFARQFLKAEEDAQDAVQDAWIGVLNGIEAFEGRSAFRTWFFTIVLNCAKRNISKRARTVLVPVFDESPDSAPTVAPSRFATGGRWPDHWAEPPSAWALPDEKIAQGELRAVVERTIQGLADGQRAVITLRDILGLSADQACTTLGITEANQRVLLHRARAHVRSALEEELGWAP